MPSSNARPRLEGYLAEFREALEAEIGVARADTRGGIGLTNGKRVSQRAAAFQYVFLAESLLNFPPDAPGDLLVGTEHHDATLISIEGVAITLSVPSDLGDFVPEAQLRTDLTFLLQKLIDRIEDSAGQPNPAGERMLGRAAVGGKPEPFDDAQLDPGQVDAVASALGRDTTFIWGPPGTGKTTTIGTIGTKLLERRETALVVSHTNVAVDQAVLTIAVEMPRDELVNGRLIRLGQPSDPRVPEETFAAYQVERRSQKLNEQFAQAELRHAVLAQEIPNLEGRLEVTIWLPGAADELTEVRAQLEQVGRLQRESTTLERELAQVQPFESRIRAALVEAQDALEAKGQVSADVQTADTLKAEILVAEQTSIRLRKELEAAEDLLKRAIEIQPAREKAARLPTAEALHVQVSRAARRLSALQSSRADLQRQLPTESRILEETRRANGLIRRLRRLPSPERQEQAVGSLSDRLDALAGDLRSAGNALDDANRAEQERARLDAQLEATASTPPLNRQEAASADARRALANSRRVIDERSADLQATEARLERNRGALEAFAATHNTDPASVLRDAQAAIERIDNLRAEYPRAQRERDELTGQLRHRLQRVLSSLVRAGFVEPPADRSLRTAFDAVQEGWGAATVELGGESSQHLRDQHAAATAEFRALTQEMERIRAALSEIEEQVIADADIIATTLTRAYLRDSIQSRRFGTVILDEASMAPIPALWIAARLADRGLVLVGDFRQLPPIVLSSVSAAEEWLGKDIFEKAGVKDRYESGAPPEYCTSLTVQHRMHPSIADIPRTLFYEGRLSDALDLDVSTGGPEWLDEDWGHDAPVLLVDTGTADAWVTSVRQGRSPSRLNFLSATISVDLAKRVLRSDRTSADPTRHRVLIVSPYRPHANLVRALLRDDGLTDEVLAGTAHSFQGSEADLVILDLVNDEPHRRVAMFTPERDDTTRRLLTVAVTRARARLIVIGDFDYIARSSRRAFMCRTFVPFLESRYPRVDALEIVPSGLTARAARAASRVRSEDVEPGGPRLVLTQDAFFTALEGDIAAADDRVVIYSPFMTRNRLSEIGLHLRAAVDRSVRVYIVTKPLEERTPREQAEYVAIEDRLRSWRITVVHKMGMHEQVVIVDDTILWTGSLNPLSQARSQEIMERRCSRSIVDEYIRILRTEDLLDAYDQGQTRCPACQSEIVAAEGRDDPYFWRCGNNDCRLSRSIDDPPLTDENRCLKCGGSVEFHERANGFAWRCARNPRHWQRIRKTHLRLPSARAYLTQRQLRQLERAFGLPADESSRGRSEQLPLHLPGDPNQPPKA